MEKRGWIILSLTLLILVGTTCYFLFARDDPRLAPLLDEAKSLGEKKLSPQEMMAEHRKLEEKARELPEKERREFHQVQRETGRQVFEKAMNERMDAYFNAPPEKKNAILDQQIREFEVMRKQMEAMFAQRRKANGTQGNGPAGNQTAANRPGGGPPPDGMGPGGPGGPGDGPRAQGGPGSNAGQRASRTPEERKERRNERRKDRLENSDPKQRARMMEYMTALRDRRKELGLPEMWGPRGNGGNRGGR